jgi:hypothetical protein
MEKELAKVFLIADNQKVLMKDFKPSEEDWTEHTLTFGSLDFNVEDYINDKGRLKIEVYFGDYLDKSFSLCGTKVLEVITKGSEVICKTYSKGMAYACHDRPEWDKTGFDFGIPTEIKIDASEIPTVINCEWKPDDYKSPLGDSIQTPKIYGYKTPDKHTVGMTPDETSKCEQRWKRMELKSQIHAQNPKITGINLQSKSGHIMDMDDTV